MSKPVILLERFICDNCGQIVALDFNDAVRVIDKKVNNQTKNSDVICDHCSQENWDG
jgi:RNase P subunit RPR2